MYCITLQLEIMEMMNIERNPSYRIICRERERRKVEKLRTVRTAEKEKRKGEGEREGEKEKERSLAPGWPPTAR
jgi:hypothetical protein